MSDPATKTASGIRVEIQDYALERIGEAAAARIAERLMPKVEEMIELKLAVLLDEAWQESIKAKAREAVDGYLTKPRTRTDSWGNAVSTETLADRIPRAVEDYMAEKVDAKGHRDTSSFRDNKGPTRLEWMLKTLVIDELKKETEKAAKDVTERARTIVAQHVGRFISEQMVPAIEVQKP
jgi:hypothetical protein